jgi:hypothetical protein
MDETTCGALKAELLTQPEPQIVAIVRFFDLSVTRQWLAEDSAYVHLISPRSASRTAGRRVVAATRYRLTVLPYTSIRPTFT